MSRTQEPQPGRPTAGPGDVVRVVWNVLEAAERPAAERGARGGVPFEATVRGVVQAPVSIGDVTEVRTAIGRLVRGRVVELDPRYPASYGTPIPALTRVGLDLRSRCWSAP